MKHKMITSLILIFMLCLSMINAPSAFAYMSDFCYEITNLPDTFMIGDEPITITEIEYVEDNGSLESYILSSFNLEILDDEGVLEVTENYKKLYGGGQSLESITIAPKKAGSAEIHFDSGITYYKTIYVIDPDIPAKKRDTPQNVKVEKYVPKKLNVSWNPVYGAKEYRVFRSTSGKDGTFKKVKTTKKTTFTDTGLTSGKTYYYKIRAVTDDGVSNFSKMKKCRVARKLNIDVQMRNKIGAYTRFAKVQVTNYGKNTFKILQDVEYIGGREFISYASYYPYVGAIKSDAIMINKNHQPLTSYSFKKDTTAVVDFKLDIERIPQKDACILFTAFYDGVYYIINAGNNHVTYWYGYPGCGIKYNDNKAHFLK